MNERDGGGKVSIGGAGNDNEIAGVAASHEKLLLYGILECHPATSPSTPLVPP